MLEQLKSVKIPVCKHIKLRFRYCIDNSVIKVLTLLLSIDIQHVGQANVFDLIMSVRDNILIRFMAMQHVCVEWETVSISYPGCRFGTKQDLLKLPLPDFRGLCENKNIDPYELSILYISLRFAGRPSPRHVKIHGIYNDESPDIAMVASNSANCFMERFVIPGTGVSYRLYFTTEIINGKTSDAKNNGNKKKSKQITKRTTQYLDPIMTFWRIGK